MIMGRHTEITAAPEQIKELETLERCGHRGESTRTKAILLTLGGSTALDIAGWHRVSVSAVKKWRSAFLERGIDGIRHKPRPGPSGHRGAAAMGIVLPPSAVGRRRPGPVCGWRRSAGIRGW